MIVFDILKDIAETVYVVIKIISMKSHYHVHSYLCMQKLGEEMNMLDY